MHDIGRIVFDVGVWMTVLITLQIVATAFIYWRKNRKL